MEGAEAGIVLRPGLAQPDVPLDHLDDVGLLLHGLGEVDHGACIEDKAGGVGNKSALGKPANQLTSVRLQDTLSTIKVRNFSHKGLKKLYEEDSAKGLPPDMVDKLRKVLTFLDEMEGADELRDLPSWKAHQLTGDRKGTWSLSVTANRRLTFRMDADEREICDVNLEDCH
jgi:proteic killer suppression protein